jgi:long-chain acyl-CoA synthetase
MDILSTVAGQTVPSQFLITVAEHGDKVALRARREDGSYSEHTYRQYASDVARCAAGLRALGFGPGQRLVMMLRNRPEFHVLDIAATFCGGTPVSIYNSSSPEQIEYLLNHSEATIAIADDLAFLQRFLAVRANVPALEHIVVVSSDAGEVPDGVLRWEALLDHPPIDLDAAAAEVKPDSLATLIYTSGTTGNPKAVMLTHQNVLSAVVAVDQLCAAHPKLSAGRAGLRLVSYLPMAHIAERNTSHYLAAMAGQEVTCCPEATQLGLFLREVKPHIVFGVPRVWEKLHAGVQAAVSGDPERAQKLKEAVDAALPIVDKLQAGTASDQEKGIYQFLEDVAFKNLRALIGLDEAIFAVTGAAPMSRDLQNWFRAIGVPLSEVYGMSETTGLITWSPLHSKTGTVGTATPGIEVKLADDGEVLCRGTGVFTGYFKEPEKTAEALDSEGWLHTGDIGQLDGSGYLRIVDRKKELIITAGGKNISPSNLEALLKGMPLVGQACAIGDDKPFVSALIALDPEKLKPWAARNGLTDLTLAQAAKHPAVIAEIEGALPAAMASLNNAERVKRLTILGSEWLPDSDELTPTSKLKRRVIHKKYAAEIDAMYATTLAPPVQTAADSGAGKRTAG